MSDNNIIIIYQDENDITRISVRFSDEDLWLTQNQLAEIYDTTQQNISQHIEGVYRDGELDKLATNKKFLLVRQEGKREPSNSWKNVMTSQSNKFTIFAA